MYRLMTKFTLWFLRASTYFTGTPDTPDETSRSATPLNIDYEKYNNESIEDYGFYKISPGDLEFHFWTRDQNETYISINPTTMEKIKNTTRPTQMVKFIIHGFLGNGSDDWEVNMMREYLKKGDYNVIIVDWSDLAARGYPIAAGYTKDVGKWTGELILAFNHTFGIPFSKFHCIGHSLGSHVCGFAGKYVKLATNITIGRITAMDPAGPLFLAASDSSRLNYDDADFVDSIHTDSYMYGYLPPLAKADFYPNGGIGPQPPCRTWSGIREELSGCSHGMSYAYFTESINSNEFIAKQCWFYTTYMTGVCTGNDYAIMGDNCTPDAEGRYYLQTNSEPPYARSGK